MSVFDPSLDRTPIWPAMCDQRELSMLRHDIRGALAGVGDGVRQLGRSELADDVRIQLERIAACADSLQWLTAEAFGEDRERESRAETDVDRLIAHLRHRFAGAASAFGTSFRVEMDTGLPARLRIDPLSLTRLLENLIAGAVERSRGGSVALAANLDKSEITFRVTGERPVGRSLGSGAAAEFDDTGDQAARALAERLGGRLDEITAVDGCTSATLRLAGTVAVANAQPTAPEPQLSGVRVLLAEDNPTNQMVAASMLRVLDAEVLVCSDGVEALEQFERYPADLVVVDIEMPRLTGLDVIRAIRARGDARAHVPIVALTAYAMREHRDRILAAGANGLIPKPITSIEAFGRELASHVRRTTSGTNGDASEDATTEGGALPVMDMAVFDQLCRTIGPDLVEELMEKVVADLVDARIRLEGALGSCDRTQIEGTAHILISVAGAFGATRLQARARALNGACRDGRLPRAAIDADARGCISEIEATLGFARSRTGSG